MSSGGHQGSEGIGRDQRGTMRRGGAQMFVVADYEKSEGFRRNQEEPEAIRSNQERSEAIRSDQKPSEAGKSDQKHTSSS